jgi:hypothetical protein
MAGIRGRSGPLGNQNAFRQGLAGIAQRRADGGALNSTEQSIREESCPAYCLIRAELRRSAPHARAGGDQRERCVAAGHVQSCNRQGDSA